MLIIDIIKKIRYNLSADRIGPDIPFTHWKLYYQNQMLKLCKRKFKSFSDTAVFRPGAYAIGCSKIVIGERVVIRPQSMLFGDSVSSETTIIIEDDVMIGSGVHIYIHNHRFDRLDIPLIDQGYYADKPVVLKSGCWVGANAVILPGVTVGRNSVIGAGSVVTKSIPDGVVAGGNPAKILKTITDIK
ncbi:Acetyltransferase (isoleucine patch superfamily) [Pedobacter steynii]|uniref:Acetyltransferase (Isoleucine patch superfamily) n=1 Tax=Pedobacter steynii TaxID=430522 RepID=A0A1G9WH94_9SPHI|nr:acyltransferase [Pedobacter steynii]NQX40293.1 acyltransferase [Pedobacter steynii]SDM83697.1 Acetyltransferase (isoleucine patch superfamily) [Pedobacter steynii]